MYQTKLTLVLTVLMFSVQLVKAQDDFKLYYQGKKLMHKREHKQALNSFDSLRIKFPDSKYLDDAAFWSAYILEMQGKERDSFAAYQNLKKTFPDSPWLDDAEIRQISIAEKLAQKDEKTYIDFLINRLASDDKTIKYQASMSLAKLRDRRALPGLRQIANNGDNDMSLMAKSLIKRIETKPVPKHPNNRIPKNQKNFGERDFRNPNDPAPKIIRPGNRSGETKNRPSSKKSPERKINRPSPKPKTDVSKPVKKK